MSARVLVAFLSGNNIDSYLLGVQFNDPIAIELMQLASQREMVEKLVIKIQNGTLYQLALSHGIQNVLKDFFSSVAQLENDVFRDPSLTSSYLKSRLSNYILIFPRLVSFLDEVIRFNQFGGLLLNRLFRLHKECEPILSEIFGQLCACVVRPFYKQLMQWISYGELDNIASIGYVDFFIRHKNYSDINDAIAVCKSDGAASIPTQYSVVLSNVPGEKVAKNGAVYESVKPGFRVLASNSPNLAENGIISNSTGVLHQNIDDAASKELLGHTLEYNWVHDFVVDYSLVPDLIFSRSFGELSHLLGRTVRLLLSSTNDFGESGSHFLYNILSPLLSSLSPAKFVTFMSPEPMLMQAKHFILSRLYRLLVKDGELTSYVDTLHDYLLLGRGDFFRTYLENVVPLLSSPDAVSATNSSLNAIRYSAWMSAAQAVGIESDNSISSESTSKGLRSLYLSFPSQSYRFDPPPPDSPPPSMLEHRAPLSSAAVNAFAVLMRLWGVQRALGTESLVTGDRGRALARLTVNGSASIVSVGFGSSGTTASRLALLSPLNVGGVVSPSSKASVGALTASQALPVLSGFLLRASILVPISLPLPESAVGTKPVFSTFSLALHRSSPVVEWGVQSLQSSSSPSTIDKSHFCVSSAPSRQRGDSSLTMSKNLLLPNSAAGATFTLQFTLLGSGRVEQHAVAGGSPSPQNTGSFFTRVGVLIQLLGRPPGSTHAGASDNKVLASVLRTDVLLPVEPVPASIDGPFGSGAVGTGQFRLARFVFSMEYRPPAVAAPVGGTSGGAGAAQGSSRGWLELQVLESAGDSTTISSENSGSAKETIAPGVPLTSRPLLSSAFAISDFLDFPGHSGTASDTIKSTVDSDVEMASNPLSGAQMQSSSRLSLHEGVGSSVSGSKLGGPGVGRAFISLASCYTEDLLDAPSRLRLSSFLSTISSSSNSEEDADLNPSAAPGNGILLEGLDIVSYADADSPTAAGTILPSLHCSPYIRLFLPSSLISSYQDCFRLLLRIKAGELGLLSAWRLMRAYSKQRKIELDSASVTGGSTYSPSRTSNDKQSILAGRSIIPLHMLCSHMLSFLAHLQFFLHVDVAATAKSCLLATMEDERSKNKYDAVASNDDHNSQSIKPRNLYSQSSSVLNYTQDELEIHSNRLNNLLVLNENIAALLANGSFSTQPAVFACILRILKHIERFVNMIRERKVILETILVPGPRGFSLFDNIRRVFMDDMAIWESRE